MTPQAQLDFSTIARRFRPAGIGTAKTSHSCFGELYRTGIAIHSRPGCRRFVRDWRLAAGSNSIRIVAAGPPGQNEQMSGCVLQQRTDKIIAQIQRDVVQHWRADL